MKDGIHPTYYDDATVKCACGATYVIGSTDKEISVEICAACHPFYTGKQKLLDAAGRIDKFRARVAAAQKSKDEKVAKEPKAEKAAKSENKDDK